MEPHTITTAAVALGVSRPTVERAVVRLKLGKLIGGRTILYTNDMRKLAENVSNRRGRPPKAKPPEPST
jgi:hypothetical protein